MNIFCVRHLVYHWGKHEYLPSEVECWDLTREVADNRAYSLNKFTFGSDSKYAVLRQFSTDSWLMTSQERDYMQRILEQ